LDLEKAMNTNTELHPEWDCTDDCLEAAERIAPIFAKMMLSEFQRHSNEEDPKSEIMKIINDVVQVNVQQAINEYVEKAFREIEIYPSADSATFILRLEPTGRDDNPLVRSISLECIRDQFGVHDPDNAEELVGALADRLEKLASELRENKGTFGWL
jgi:hypothetical protein